MTNLASNALFRGCAAVGRSPIVSSTVGVLAMYAVVFSGGIMLRRTQIRGWWIWLYWISPVSFAVRSMALNEFTTAQWSAPYEYDPAITIGDASLAAFGIQTGYWWVWLGVGVLAGYAILFNTITTLALTFLSYPQKRFGMTKEIAAAIDADAVQDTASHCKADKGGKASAAVTNPGPAYGGSPITTPTSPPAGAVPGSAQAGSGVQPMSSQPLPDLQDDDTTREELSLALPFVPVALAFKDVHYWVKHPHGSGELELLKVVEAAVSRS